jgi:hypothetical protein
MIDIGQEELIAIRDVPRELPKRPNGRRLHTSAVYRWLSRGVRGVVLESVKIGGTTYTSKEAMARFAERLSGAATQPRQTPKPPHSRQLEIERAAKRLDTILGGKREG